jgi:hypothetical protein
LFDSKDNANRAQKHQACLNGYAEAQLTFAVYSKDNASQDEKQRLFGFS